MFSYFRPFPAIPNIFKHLKIEINVAKRKTKEATVESQEAPKEPKAEAVPSSEKKAIEKPVWLKFSEEDVIAIILKLAKQGLTSEKIGLELRDTYGLPTTKLYGRKISKILKENGLYKDSTLKNLEQNQANLVKHLEKNKQDKKTKRALTIITARISELKKYKKRKNVEQNQESGREISKTNGK